MQNLKTIASLGIFLPIICASSLSSAQPNLRPNGMDRDRQFRLGGGGHLRGNEGSLRPRDFVAGQMSYGGNGCPDGTMRAVFAPDNLSFSILFDQFVAEVVPDQNGENRARMSCDAVIPITIPQGQQMEITRVDYRGFVALPQNAAAQIHSVFAFLQPRVPNGNGWVRARPQDGGWFDRDRINIRYNFAGPLMENYEISTGSMNGGQGLPQSEVSPCGGEARLRIHNEVRVRSPRQQQASITVDSIDGSANATYFVNWRACSGFQPPPPPPGPWGEAVYGPFLLNTGQALAVGNLRLIMQFDGNLVLYGNVDTPRSVPLWATNTHGRSCGDGSCVANFQSDGNLVLYQYGAPYWASGTHGGVGYQLKISANPHHISIWSQGGLIWPR